MIVTIFVRHSPGCKYAGDEFHKGCKCRKHRGGPKGASNSAEQRARGHGSRPRNRTNDLRIMRRRKLGVSCSVWS